MQTELNSLLEEAGLSLSDYARLLGVSRVTIHSWSKGKANPHKLLANKNNKLMSAVTAAVALGDLPLLDVPRSERMSKLKGVLVRHLRG